MSTNGLDRPALVESECLYPFLHIVIRVKVESTVFGEEVPDFETQLAAREVEVGGSTELPMVLCAPGEKSRGFGDGIHRCRRHSRRLLGGVRRADRGRGSTADLNEGDVNEVL